jgi:hypothetical protein
LLLTFSGAEGGGAGAAAARNPGGLTLEDGGSPKEVAAKKARLAEKTHRAVSENPTERKCMPEV